MSKMQMVRRLGLGVAFVAIIVASATVHAAHTGEGFHAVTTMHATTSTTHAVKHITFMASTGRDHTTHATDVHTGAKVGTTQCASHTTAHA